MNKRLVVLFGVGLLLLPASLFGKGPKPLKYHRIVSMGVDFVRGGDYCGGIVVNLEAGDFFEGLEVRSTSSGKQFLKGTQAVVLFPKEMMATVSVFTDRCVGPPDPNQIQPEFVFDTKLIASLRFEAFWQRGFEKKNANLGLFSSGELGRDSFESGISTNAWRYVLTIKCQDIPLTDTLVIKILSPDGQLVSRLSQRMEMGQMD
jgi:hypothetical protein